jgi:hypothetical protein
MGEARRRREAGEYPTGTGALPPITAATFADFPRWCAWRTELDARRKPTKVPYCAVGRRASSTDPRTWLTRPQAQAIADQLSGTLKGVGIFLGPCEEIVPGHGILGADLDNCREPITGAVTVWALGILKVLRTYTEVSPGTRGVKALGLYRLADLPALRAVLGIAPDKWGREWKPNTGKDHPPGIELYLGRRYFAVTDMRVEHLPGAEEYFR